MEIRNSLLERIKKIENGEKYIKVLENCSEDVLDSLLFVKNDNNLNLILKYYKDINDLEVETNAELLLIIIDIICEKGKIDSLYGNIIYGELNFKDKLECLNSMLKAKMQFQEEKIYNFYVEGNLYRDLASNIILSSCKIQADVIYNVFNRCQEGNEYNSTFIEVAKLMSKVKDAEILYRMEDLLDNKKLLESGCVTVVANLITKCKNYDQVMYITSIFDDVNEKVDMEHIPYAIEACNYFLLTKDKTTLKNLYDYICDALCNKLPISLDNINLIINARHDYNGKYAVGALTNPEFIKAHQEDVMAGVFSDSRKEYHADIIQNKIFYWHDPEFCISAGMIVNDAENKKKAKFITDNLTKVAEHGKISEDTFAYAALMNRVYTDIELRLINNLSHNIRLKELGVALPLSRLIALEEEENDRLIIWNALQNEDTKEKFYKGLNDLYFVTNPKDYKKVEKIINNILKDINILDLNEEEEKVLKRR